MWYWNIILLIVSGAYAAAPADKKKNPAGSVHQSTTHPPTTQPPITHGLIHSPCILAEQSRGSTHGPGRAEIGALPLSQNPGRGKLKCSIPGKKTNEKEPYTIRSPNKKSKTKKKLGRWDSNHGPGCTEGTFYKWKVLAQEAYVCVLSVQTPRMGFSTTT